MNDDFDGPEPKTFQCEHDGLLHRLIREGIRFVLIRPEHRLINLYIVDHISDFYLYQY